MRLLPTRSSRSHPFGRRSAVAALMLVFSSVVVLSTIFVLSALHDLADHADLQDNNRSRETAAGAIATFSQQLQAIAEDHAGREALALALAQRDPGRMAPDFSAITGRSDLFDVAIIVDAAANGVAAYRDGVALETAPSDYIDSSLPQLLQAVAQGQPPAGFARTRDGIAALGIAAIRPAGIKPDGVARSGGDAGHFLILARYLDQNRLDALADAYVLDGLRLVSSGEAGANALPLADAGGNALSDIIWNPRRPGAMAYNEARPRVYSALAMVGLYFVLLVVSGTKAFNRVRADEAAARRLAMTDRLSGLLNRSGFFLSLQQMVEESAKAQCNVVLLYLDLDGFKEVNDAYGHATGDALIRGVSAGLRMLIPPQAIFGRVGGDEFAIAMPAGDHAGQVRLISDRILGFFDEPFILGERVATVGTSIGVAVSAPGQVSGEELVRRADMAMYRVKESGRGRVEYYRPEMDHAREERNRLEVDLRIAIERRELHVFFQPLVDASTWRLIGVEALARWDRKGYGPVSPEVFIPIAESSGLIDQLGLFILHRSCQMLAHWPDLSLSVNISPGQFRDPAFALHVHSVFRKTGTDPARVTLEMTEGYFIQNAERARAAMTKLRQIGVQIALDDFGSGFSSVGYLRQFGFDRLKIDKALVQSVDDGDHAVEMLRATVSLARSLGIPVTAEGVETQSQAVGLYLTGCDELQGYMFGRPMPAEEIDAIYWRDRLPAGVAAPDMRVQVQAAV